MVMKAMHLLPAGYALTVTPAFGARVTVACREDSGENAFLRAARSFGPYLVPRTFDVSGDATAAAAVSTVGASLAGLLIASAGAPEDAAQATISVNPTGDENGLTFTAREYGVGGNDITITYVDSGVALSPLAVSVVGKAITVSLENDDGPSIVSTAAEVLAAVAANASAAELVSVVIMDGDTGESDDGSGVVTAMASTALADGAGTGIGQALPGCLCIDTTNGVVYRNAGTRAAPIWAALADA